MERVLVMHPNWVQRYEKNLIYANFMAEFFRGSGRWKVFGVKKIKIICIIKKFVVPLQRK